MVFLFNCYDFFIDNIAKHPAKISDLMKSFFWFSLAAGGTWMRSLKYKIIVCAGSSIVLMDCKGKQNPDNFINYIFSARDNYLSKINSQHSHDYSLNDNSIETNVYVN